VAEAANGAPPAAGGWRWQFVGDVEPVWDGLQILAQRGRFTLGPGGRTIQVTRGGNHAVEVGVRHGQGYLRYQTPAHFFRGVGLWLEHGGATSDWAVVEDAAFRSVGVMLDASRNAVPTVASIHRLLDYMALMGFNLLMLYTEDVYTVDGRPYFGYLRGRYRPEELRACDDYAQRLGIEMVPCIQTLAHLGQVLKWEPFAELRDVQDILLVGDERSYQLVDDMIAAATAPFRSQRIHIGMDEAALLGRGRYLLKHGYRPGFEIMLDHLERVAAIAERRHLRAMMWSDMWFALGSASGDLYDPAAAIPPEVQARMPKNLDYVFWDYYHTDSAFYEKMLARQKSWGVSTVFAGGVWMWTGFGVNYGRTLDTTEAGLTASKRQGIQEVFCTLWGDGGNETNHFGTLLGLQLFAEHAYHPQVDLGTLPDRFRACTGADAGAFWDLRLLDEGPGVPLHNLESANPSKYLLWQDPLLGLFDWHAAGLPLAAHYRDVEERMRRHESHPSDLSFVFGVPRRLAAVLRTKADLGVRLAAAYAAGDREQLAQMADRELPDLIERVEALRQAHRVQWFATYKPFGWEVLDQRYGGLTARLHSTRERLYDYLSGAVAALSELEAERLPFARPVAGGQAVSVNNWARTVSASYV